MFGHRRENNLLRARIAQRDQEIAALTRQLDDLLDREAMYCLDRSREVLATPAAIQRAGQPRERHSESHHGLDVPEVRATAAGLLANELGGQAQRAGRVFEVPDRSHTREFHAR